MLFGSNLVPFRSTLEIVKSSGCFPAASKWDLAAFQESLLVLFSAHWKRKKYLCWQVCCHAAARRKQSINLATAIEAWKKKGQNQALFKDIHTINISS
jgi:hypothetical protein